MSVMASWNGKTWGVSPERIAALNGVSASVELDTENSDDKAGSPATKTKALKLQSMSFDFDLGVAVGCDVRGEYESWTALVGQYAPFYLGGTRFGPANLQLTGVSLGDTTVDNFGRILKGKITINKLVDYICWITLAGAFGATFGDVLNIPILSAIIILIIYGIELSSCFNNYFEARGWKFRINVFKLFGQKKLEDAVEEVKDSDEKKG